MVEKLRDDAKAAMRPDRPEAVVAIVLELVAEYPGELSDAALNLRADAYFDALDDVPVWAIREARRYFRRGEHDAKGAASGFPPAPAEIRRLAQIALDRCKVRVGQMITLLKAEPIKRVAVPAEIRARSAALARQIAAGIGGREAPTRRARALPATDAALIEKMKRGEEVTDEMVAEAERGVVIH